jgi:hypothetical protein
MAEVVTRARETLRTVHQCEGTIHNVRQDPLADRLVVLHDLELAEPWVREDDSIRMRYPDTTDVDLRAR